MRFILWAFIIWNVLSVILPGGAAQFQPNYDQHLYQTLENLYNQSQYRQKNPTSIIPDHTVFRYAAGAYLRGVDPILINSEHTPLGKYFIALSIFLFRNDGIIIIFFALFTLFAILLISRNIFHNSVWGLIPVVLFSAEPLFLDQIRVAPMLDIIQLPFIFLSLYFFLKEYKHEKFIFTSIMIGLVIATKTLVPGLLLITCFTIFLLAQRLLRSLFMLFMYLPIAALILIASYTRTFMNGHTFGEFIGFQKWILLYQQSKLLYPFSAWRLVFLNQWQTWWGDRTLLEAVDWRVTWPLSTGLTVVLIVVILMKKWRVAPSVLLLVIWAVVYAAFLSLGVISSRFLLPFLPISFVLGVYVLRRALQ
ncbi:MAG: hypothetical protein UY16_C0001G0026 [Candidatus Gottesmanbacteria bacterium GW2011_GWA2_47_9]|uniref:Glycosyltransferase RgtA/B/C/D-like domain-containing protein n=1 Tax=Candidatus Gottesmanbacteria bacterium GW2011_GWA2_47_9 TaxID=1618445 RepID=A0A0G1U462_9BACT|nr:MAG: hypothetical protein UY16_C0001G0026 [Candidatus Gottesmanbacteria bacterium GW2011_GWA2_47_9]